MVDLKQVENLELGTEPKVDIDSEACMECGVDIDPEVCTVLGVDINLEVCTILGVDFDLEVCTFLGVDIDLEVLSLGLILTLRYVLFLRFLPRKEILSYSLTSRW